MSSCSVLDRKGMGCNGVISSIKELYTEATRLASNKCLEVKTEHTVKMSSGKRAGTEEHDTRQSWMSSTITGALRFYD